MLGLIKESYQAGERKFDAIEEDRRWKKLNRIGMYTKGKTTWKV